MTADSSNRETAPKAPASTLRNATFAALLIALTFALYAELRSHDFIGYDDPIYITHNPSLTSGFDWDTVVRAFAEPYETNWIPLTWISYHVDRALFGLAPAGTHLLNVSLHAASAVILYFALFAMTRAFWPCAFVATVFAVHPLHVESVAWASERKDTLSGLFFMLTLLAYGRYAARPRSIAAYLLVALAMTLGLLAKPMLVSTPIVLLLLDYWPLQRLRAADGGIERSAIARCALEKLPLVAIVVAVAAVTMIVQDDAGAMATNRQVALVLRVTNSLTSYWIYLADTIWPTGLAIFYPHPMKQTPGALAVLMALGLALVTWLAFRNARERPYLPVGWFWYLVTLVPVIGLVQVGMQSHADRYMYLPQIGITIAVAWGARGLFVQSRRTRIAIAASGCAVIVALSIASFRQVTHWRDTTTVFAHAVEVTTDNFVAHEALAVELLAAGEAGRAEHHFGRAAQIKPRWPEAHIGLGDARFAQGRIEESIADYKRGVQLAPRKPSGHIHLARALADAGQWNLAIHHLRRAIDLGRDSPDATAHAYLASIFSRTDRLPQAEAQYRRALRIDPGYGEAHSNLGFVLIRQQRYAEAQQYLDRALALAQDSAELHFGLGIIALERGDAARAVRHLRVAHEKRPAWDLPANNLAWILATHPDPEIREPLAAIEVAESLRRKGEPLKPDKLDTLAAAYASAGRFTEAGLTAAAAAELARKAGNDALAGEIEAREQLYRANRAFIQPPHPQLN